MVRVPVPLVRAGAALRAAWRPLAPYSGVLAFVGGFLWDALTLVRIDRFADNVLLASYLATLAALLVLEHRVAEAPSAWPRLAPRHEWLTTGVQFLFGGLFSAYLVFYGRAASFGPSLGFVVALAALFVVNEFLHDVLRAVWLRLALFGLVAFAFLLYAIPVLLGFASRGLVALAGVLAAAAVVAVGAAMGLDAELDGWRRYRRTGGLAAVVVGALLLADRAGLVPPMPFALVDVGVASEVRRTDRVGEAGRVLHEVRVEAPPWWAPWRRGTDRWRVRPGEQPWVYTAVFAPDAFELRLYHRWQRWDEAAGTWEDTDGPRGIEVTRRSVVRGGETLGFRTWSTKRAVTPGTWRVLVLTEDARELGRLQFDVLPDDGATAAWVWRPWA